MTCEYEPDGAPNVVAGDVDVVDVVCPVPKATPDTPKKRLPPLTTPAPALSPALALALALAFALAFAFGLVFVLLMVLVRLLR